MVSAAQKLLNLDASESEPEKSETLPKPVEIPSLPDSSCMQEDPPCDSDYLSASSGSSSSHSLATPNGQAPPTFSSWTNGHAGSSSLGLPSFPVPACPSRIPR